MNSSKSLFANTEIVSVYTSKQAVEDGLLIPINNPIINYLTASIWERCTTSSCSETDTNAALSKLIKDVLSEIIHRGNMIQIIPSFRLLNDFYKVETNGFVFFLARNETGRFTLMFPEDY